MTASTLIRHSSNKFIQKIIDLQHDDGSWGYFHSLSQPTKSQPITTEMALKRLYILGLRKNDEPIAKAIKYLQNCLLGNIRLPDRREKVINWDIFEEHMLAAWLRIFEINDSSATLIAQFWAELISAAFQSGRFDENAYAIEYRKRIPILNKGERRIGISQFYMVNLLKGMLDSKIESLYIDSIINSANGIYYVYSSKIAEVPSVFASRQTSFYLAALEQIADYSCAKEKLQFAVKWLLNNKSENGEWDLGTSVKDGVYFPLSESWRKPEYRISDCTTRIELLLGKLK